MGRVIFAALIVVLVIGAAAFYMGYGARAVVPAPQAIPGGTNQQTANGSSATTAPAASSPTPGAGEVRVDVSQATLSDQLSANLVGKSLGSTPFGDATVKQIGLQLHPGEIDIDGTAAAGVASLPFKAVAGVQAQGGRAVVSVKSADVAGVPLPAAVQSQLQDVMQQRLDAAVQQQDVQIHSVTVNEGSMTILGARTP